MKALTHKVNGVLKPLFAGAGIDLVDYKLEFGHPLDEPGGPLVLGDEFTPDGCRLWDAKTGDKMDKDRFRRDLGSVIEHYREVGRRIARAAVATSPRPTVAASPSPSPRRRPDLLEARDQRLRGPAVPRRQRRPRMVDVEAMQVVAAVDDHQRVHRGVRLGAGAPDGDRRGVAPQQRHHPRARRLDPAGLVDDDSSFASFASAQERGQRLGARRRSSSRSRPRSTSNTWIDARA